MRSQEKITPGQVRALEAFAKAHTRTDFKLILDVTPITEVNDQHNGDADPQCRARRPRYRLRPIRIGEPERRFEAACSWLRPSS